MLQRSSRLPSQTPEPHAHTHAHARTRTHAHARTHTYTHTHTHARTHARTHTHTHTHKDSIPFFYSSNPHSRTNPNRIRRLTSATCKGAPFAWRLSFSHPPSSAAVTPSVCSVSEPARAFLANQVREEKTLPRSHKIFPFCPFTICVD